MKISYSNEFKVANVLFGFGLKNIENGHPEHCNRIERPCPELIILEYLPLNCEFSIQQNHSEFKLIISNLYTASETPHYIKKEVEILYEFVMAEIEVLTKS